MKSTSAPFSRLFCVVMGIFYLFFGICGFVPQFVYPPIDRLQYQHMLLINSGYGWIFTALPSNIVHNVVYVLIGAGAIVSILSPRMSTLFCRGMFVIATGFVFLGLFPFWYTWQLWGIMPLYGWNVGIHVVTAVLCWYFGFIYLLEKDVHASAFARTA